MDFAARYIVVNCIEGYQRYISPYKGFCCAHRAVHNGASCSEWAKRAINKVGVMGAFPIIIRRFKACHATYKSLAQLSKSTDEGNVEKREELNNNPFKDKLGCCVDALPCLPI